MKLIVIHYPDVNGRSVWLKDRPTIAYSMYEQRSLRDDFSNDIYNLHLFNISSFT